MKKIEESVKKKIEAVPRILFIRFLDVFIGPTPFIVPYERSPGKLTTRSAHIWSQRKLQQLDGTTPRHMDQ